MKQTFFKAMAIVAFLILLSGCSSTSESEESAVDSGTIDESYVGDPNPTLTEEYKQTEEEAQIQADVLKKIEENPKTEREAPTGKF